MTTNAKRKPMKQTKLDCRQFMEMAVKFAARETPILRGIIQDSCAALFSCDYDVFLSHAEQSLTMKPAPEVAYLIEQALVAFDARLAKETFRRIAA